MQYNIQQRHVHVCLAEAGSQLPQNTTNLNRLLHFLHYICTCVINFLRFLISSTFCYALLHIGLAAAYILYLYVRITMEEHLSVGVITCQLCCLAKEFQHRGCNIWPIIIILFVTKFGLRLNLKFDICAVQIQSQQFHNRKPSVLNVEWHICDVTAK